MSYMHYSSVGRSCLAAGKDAVDCLDRVALLPGLACHEPTLMRFGSAELAWACVVGIYPTAVADDVTAIAIRLAAVCV